jgi:hypothetical protein
VPDEHRGQAQVTVTGRGLEAGVGVRIWKGLSAGAYASRTWAG